MLSFWERESFTEYDFLIIGGGIVGLSTAIELKETHPHTNVAVVERGVFPSGASTRNAGFACFGSLTEVLSDLEKLPEAAVFKLVKRRWDGLQLLRTRLGDEVIDYQNHGGYELLQTESQLGALEQADRVNSLLKPLFEHDVYQNVPEKTPALGFDTNRVKGLVFNQYEAQIHTGKMMKALQRLAMARGIDLLTGTGVRNFVEDNGHVDVKLENGTVLKAGRVGICTNAFTRKLVQEANLKPGRGVVLVTKPVQGLKFKGTFHYDEGYYYFRNYGNRIIFGGGRNLDLEGETTTEFGVPDKILSRLKEDLINLILPGQSYEIEQVWSGIMAFGDTKQPVLRQQSDRVFLGVRLGGMGVAIGSLLGKELAELITQSGNN
ncbi:MAG: FAD-binding oxidoreductase [Roseivirga sp.]|nr:FAD-binding oxidoreductase [Roseivirga sp.]